MSITSYQQFHNLFCSLMQTQNYETEQNMMLFINFMECQPDQFIEYCKQSIKDPQLCGPTAVVLRKQMSKMGKETCYILASEQARLELLQNTLEMLSCCQDFSMGKILADCIALMVIKNAEAKTNCPIVFSFIEQALSSNVLVIEKCAAEIIAEMTQNNLNALMQVGYEQILTSISKILNNPNTKLFGAKAISNLLIGSSFFNGIPIQQQNEFLHVLFSMAQQTQDPKELLKVCENIYQISEDNMDVLIDHMEAILNLTEYMFMQNSPILFNTAINLFANIVDPYSPYVEYTDDEELKIQDIILKYIFQLLLDQNDDFVFSFSQLDDPSDGFDLNSNEVLVLECMKRVAKKHWNQMMDAFNQFQTSQGSWQHTYASLYIMQAFLGAEEFIASDAQLFQQQTKDLVKEIGKFNAVIQYKICDILHIAAQSSYKENLVHLITNLGELFLEALPQLCDQAICKVLEVINTVFYNSITDKQVIPVLRVLHKNEAMLTILAQIPSLLQKNSKTLQGLTLQLMTTALRLNNPLLIQAYSGSIQAQFDQYIYLSQFIDPKLAQSDIKYYVKLTDFVSRAIVVYAKYDNIQAQVPQIVQIVMTLFKSDSTDEIHALMDCLIDFVQNVLKAFPAQFADYTMHISNRFVEIIVQPKHVEPGLLENKVEMDYKTHLKKQLELIYDSLSVLFEFLPEQMSPYAHVLFEALDKEQQYMSSFTFADQAKAICMYPKCFEGQQCFEAVMQVLKKYSEYVSKENCANTAQKMLQNYPELIKIVNQKQCLNQTVVDIVMQTIFQAVKGNNVQFQTYLNRNEGMDPQDSDQMPVDYERNEVCRLGETIGLIVETILGICPAEVQQGIITLIVEFSKQNEMPPLQFYMILACAKYLPEQLRVEVLFDFASQILGRIQKQVLYRGEILYLTHAIACCKQLQSSDIYQVLKDQRAILLEEKSDNIVCIIIAMFVTQLAIVDQEVLMENFQEQLQKFVSVSGFFAIGAVIAQHITFWKQQPNYLMMMAIMFNSFGPTNYKDYQMELQTVTAELKDQLEEFEKMLSPTGKALLLEMANQLGYIVGDTVQ
ncbi:Conserved_hypothetical protein [Hexamita inflata]|uniref:Uncharacterized protein n=1 Tax=Hexamita inflata TaxID=28002 RepID=A0AA86TLQ9_9EUKA|nr:Conserved hypothetical protein [Hexamita inflata]CAI9965758.1 Conserved hypothetical protein [Hexamita inflata]